MKIDNAQRGIFADKPVIRATIRTPSINRITLSWERCNGEYDGITDEGSSFSRFIAGTSGGKNDINT